MTLNDLERRNGSLCYFNKFAKPAFQLITGSSSIALIDQKSASVTHIAVKLVCITKFPHSRVKWISPYLLVIYRLSFALPLWWLLVACFRSIVKHCFLCASLLYFVVRVGWRCKTVHVRYLISLCFYVSLYWTSPCERWRLVVRDIRIHRPVWMCFSAVKHVVVWQFMAYWKRGYFGKHW